ncbi:MAG: 30S ribosomal protein S6 [Dissulfuribacterales bacterium]
MNHYETIFIVDPDTPDTDREPIFEKLKSMIAETGMLVIFDDWGVKKLAYEIKKKIRGRYVRLDYCGNGDLVDAIERIFRLDFRILKYMTILLGKDVDPETLIIKEDEAQVETKTDLTESKEDASDSQKTDDDADSVNVEKVVDEKSAEGAVDDEGPEDADETAQTETKTETETEE